MDEISPRIEVEPFRRSEELRDALLANLDQLPQPLQILDPDFEVCGREERTILAVDGEQRLLAIVPFTAGKEVRVEEVLVALRTLDNFLPWIARIFPHAGVNVHLSPRPVIIAEEISREVVGLIGRLRGEYTCLTYTPLRVGQMRTLLLRPVSIDDDTVQPSPFRDGSDTAWDFLAVDERRVLFG
ncbi:MAG: hypothetical protein PVF51_02500 [Nitrospirota bacterium]|jgi:hypothetical protein